MPARWRRQELRHVLLHLGSVDFGGGMQKDMLRTVGMDQSSENINPRGSSKALQRVHVCAAREWLRFGTINSRDELRKRAAT